MKTGAYSVYELNHLIHEILADEDSLNRIKVKGEVSNLKYHSSGHIYFSLKDSKSQIKAVMFRGSRERGLTYAMKDGDMVEVTGRVEVYEISGIYQLYASLIEQAGVGNLYQKFLELKQELSDEGMFAPEYKRPIPTFQKRIGIVTSPTGAAVRDIITNIRKKNPYVELVLFPAKVQGEGSAESISAGIVALNRLGVDMIIAGRGGGSLEDLWAFNEELVARTIFASEVPVISAVGHETDTSISDFVADARVSTPTAAASYVFDYVGYIESLSGMEEALGRVMKQRVFNLRKSMEAYGYRLKALSPQSTLNNKRTSLMETERRLQEVMDRRLKAMRYDLGILAGRLEGVSPARRLASGFSYVVNDKDQNLTDAENVSVGDEITVYMKKGRLKATVSDVEADVKYE